MSDNGLSGLPTAVLFDQARDLAHRDPILQSEEYWERVRTLHLRGTADVFDLGAKYCSDPDPVVRAVGANVLAQIGARSGLVDYPFADQSAPVLLRMLTDTDEVVMAAALSALGFLKRGDPAELAKLAQHASDDVRFSVVCALLCRTDQVSIETLIRLSNDQDVDVRDWATFGLGSQCEEDSPQIRAALLARLDDEGDDVRGEALVGLAHRKDERVVEHILRELSQPGVLSLAIEAAGMLPRAAFLPYLEDLLTAHPEDATIRDALTACREA